MLDTALKQQLRSIFQGLDNSFTFEVSVAPEHESRQELLEVLNDVSECSAKLSGRI